MDRPNKSPGQTSTDISSCRADASIIASPTQAPDNDDVTESKQSFLLQRVSCTVEANDLQDSASINPTKSQLNPDYCPLQYANVSVKKGAALIPAIIDSGAETEVANPLPPTVAKIGLKSVFGEAINTDLIVVNIR
jgi:hypothetical protein